MDDVNVVIKNYLTEVFNLVKNRLSEVVLNQHGSNNDNVWVFYWDKNNADLAFVIKFIDSDDVKPDNNRRISLHEEINNLLAHHYHYELPTIVDIRTILYNCKEETCRTEQMADTIVTSFQVAGIPNIGNMSISVRS